MADGEAGRPTQTSRHQDAPKTLAEEARFSQWDNYPPQLASVMEEAWRGLNTGLRWQEFRGTFHPSQWPTLLVVGKESPNADRKLYEDGSALITISDGLIRFLQNTCDALVSNSTFRKKGGEITEATALEPPQADDLLLQTYLQWAALKRGEMPSRPSVELGPQASSMARNYRIHALLFVALHEFGHVVLHRNEPREAQRELEADAWAAETLLDMDGRPPIEQNIALLGSIVSLRTFAALDALGLWYLGDYPPPSTRFQTVLRVFRRRFPDEISFYLASTYVYSLDLRMESAENHLRRLPTRRDQIVSHIVSLLAAVHDERMVLPQAAEVANRVLANSWLRPAEVLAQASNTFSSKQPSYSEDSEWGSKVRFVIDNLPRLQALLAP
jgi:hypothetical protein